MNFNFRRQALISAVMGLLGVGMTGYSSYKAILAWQLQDDPLANALFTSVPVFLFLCTLFLLYIGAAYAFGELRSVTGSRESAMLIGPSGVMAYPVRIRFSRIVHPDHENANLPPSQRHALFIVGWRPWVCPESTFLKDAVPDASPPLSADRTDDALEPKSLS